MKKKTIWSLALALALVVSAIGASTAALAAAPDTAEPATTIATENEDAIWEQIEAIEEKSDAIFQRNAAMWEKLDEICNALPDDYDFTNFDEAAFIRSTNALTEAEKETLLADIKELNGLDAEMEALYEKLPDCDNMPLYEKALEKAYSREDLLSAVWGFDSDVETRVTDETLRRIRKKLLQAGSTVSVSTIWGFGYKLKGAECT